MSSKTKLSDDDVDRIAERLAVKLAERQHINVMQPQIHIDPHYVPALDDSRWRMYNPYRVTC